MYLTSAVYGWTVVSFCFSSLFFSFWPPFSVSAGFKPSMNSAKTGFLSQDTKVRKFFFLFYFILFSSCFVLNKRYELQSHLISTDLVLKL